MCTEIKILQASCCGKNSPIKTQIEQIAQKHQIAVCIEELSDLKDTMVYGTMTFPSLVIHDQVVDYKKYQTDTAILELLTSNKA